MIHTGAIVAAGLSQGSSKTLGPRQGHTPCTAHAAHLPSMRC